MLALVTSSSARALDADLPLLLTELPGAVVVTWDDPAVDWNAYATVVIRSTWDYHDRLDRYLEWARSVAEVTALWNPLQLVEWNADKRYLLDLADEGVPIVPTSFVDLGDDVPPCFGDVVVKPSVGAGSIGVKRFDGDPDGARHHIDRLRRRGAVAMVQPYLGEIDQRGETGLVFLGGEYSHAFRKESILSSTIEWEGGMFAKERTRATVPSSAERALGDRIIAALPPTAYARVDLVPGDSGPLLLELELVEPSLFLHLDPAAPARAAAVFRSLME
ncbi:MAG: ATP-grasp domain-containing protein [Ilumatobacteraceae bacterium]